MHYGYGGDVYYFSFIFTLYPADSRVGKESLVLRYLAPHFPLNSRDVAFETLSSGTQRRALSWHQSKEMKIFNISFSTVGNEPTNCRVTRLCAMTGLNYSFRILIYVNLLYLPISNIKYVIRLIKILILPRTNILVWL